VPIPPKRRFEVRLDIGGDSWDDILEQVDFLGIHLAGENGPKCNSVMGGNSSSHVVVVVERPDVTPDKYRAALLEYRHQLKLEKERGIETPQFDKFTEEVITGKTIRVPILGDAK
jgi:hypothetical protein